MSDVEILSGRPRHSLDELRRVVAVACHRAGATRAILFGSYARGSADAYSDLDLLVVCATELPFLDRFRLFEDVLDAFPGSDLLVYTPAEVEELRDAGVVSEALREGIVVYEASGNASGSR